MNYLRFTKTDSKVDIVEFVSQRQVLEKVQNSKQGILPHDFIHAIVEDHFRIRGFIDLVFEGQKPEYAMKADGEAWLSEAIVEAIQGMLWSGKFELNQFNDWIKSICTQRNGSVFAASEIQFAELSRSIQNFTKQWQNLPSGASVDFQWRK